MPYFTVAAGQVIASNHVNTAIGQSILRFSNAAQRDQQLPAPTVGMFCYLMDVNILQVYDNQIVGGANAWHPAGGLRMGYATVGVAQSIPNNNVATLVKLGTVGGAANKAGRATWNTDGSVSLPYAGTYLVTGSVCWPANNTGERRCYIRRKSGTTWSFSGVAGGAQEINTGAVGSTYLRQSITAQAYCNAGDQLGMWVQHSANAALVLVGGEDVGKLAVQLLGSD